MSFIHRTAILFFSAATLCLFNAVLAGAQDPKAENSEEASGRTAYIQTKPLEEIIPCDENDEREVYVLRAQDGHNIQVAIECRRGKLTALWPEPEAEATP